MKNASDELISRLDTAEKRISELEYISVETSETKQQREQRLKEKTKNKRTPKDHGTTTKGVTYI